MLNVFNALFPVFLVIATGAALRASKIIPDSDWRGIENVTYYVLFPAVLMLTMATAPLSSLPIAGVGGALLLAILIMAALLMLIRPLLERLGLADGPAFTSLFQGATRWNSFAVIAIAGSLYGREGLTLIAISVAAMIPALNVMAVLVLARYAKGDQPSVGTLLLTMIKNPFIWSVLSGAVIAALHIPLPTFLTVYGDILGRAGLATGLLMVGAGLDLGMLRRPRVVTWLACGLKLMLMPLMAALLARAFGVTGTAFAIVLMSAGAPTASGAYVLAKRSGGDAPLMAEILTIQTLIGIATMGVILVVFAA